MSENVKISATGKKKNTLRIAISDSLTIDITKTVKEKLISQIAQYQTIELDLIQLHNVDLSGVQLIIAIKNYCSKHKKELVTKADISEEISQLMENCGIASSILN